MRRIVARFADGTRIRRDSVEKACRYEIVTRDGKYIGGISTLDNGEIYIDDLYIMPRYTRRGYATRLLVCVLEQPTAKFVLDVLSGNDIAISLYTKLGFVAVLESDGLIKMEKHP